MFYLTPFILNPDDDCSGLNPMSSTARLPSCSTSVDAAHPLVVTTYDAPGRLNCDLDVLLSLVIAYRKW